MISHSFAIWLSAVVVGLSVAAPIGPVNVEIIRRGLTRGPRAAFALGLGAVSADCIYFTVAFLATDLASAILDSRLGMAGGLLAGGGMLAWIASLTLRSALAPSADSPIPGEEGANSRPASGLAGTYLTGLAMTLANPMTIVFWLTIAASFRAGHEEGSPILRLAGVAAGALAWVTSLTLALAFARPWVTPRVLRGVNLISGIALLGFAASFGMRALKLLI